jgi:stage V sporulation protein B
MSVMLLPEVSSAQAQKNNSHIANTMNRSVQVCMIMGIISTFLFLFYGARFGAIIFHETSVEYFVKILAMLCPFYYLTTTLGSILNGLGRTTLTCIHNIAGILIRIASLIILVPVMGIKGYMFGLLISQLGVCIAHYICLNRTFHIGINAKENIVIPTINSLISVGISMLVYIPLSIFSWGSEPFRLSCAACVCTVVFFLLTGISRKM